MSNFRDTTTIQPKTSKINNSMTGGRRSESLMEGEADENEDSPTVNLQVFVCSICGEDHETDNCTVVRELTQIYDSRILTRARQTLPQNLEVKVLVDGTTSVITNVKIDQGSQFGPFEAPLSLDLPPTVLFPLKVFGKSFEEGYYLDTSDEESCNWMCLVAPATNTREQNLICYDVKQSIYFATTRDVQPGEELRLWYALYYGLKLQTLPLADECTEDQGAFDSQKDDVDCKLKFKRVDVALGEDSLQTLTQHLPAHVLGASGERNLWICKLCGDQETNVACYARHLMTHYCQPLHHNLHPQCRICAKYFFSKKALDKHLSRTHDFYEDESKVLPHNGRRCVLPQPECKSREADKPTIIKMKDWLGEASSEAVDLLSIRNKKRLTSDKLKASDPSEINVEKASSSTSPLHMLSKACPKRVNASATPETFCGYHGESKDSLALSSESKPIHHKRLDQGTCHPPDAMEEQGINTEESQRKHEELKVDASSCGKLPASIVLAEEDLALYSEDAVQFTVLEPSHGCETYPSVKDKNEDPNCDSTLHLACDGSSVLPLNVIDSSVTFIQLASSDEIILPFTCDICQKSFQKCSYLYRHLRKHTGEFTCITCLAVFARKENLKTHSCSQPKEWFPCLICGKKFSAKKYLQRHVPMHTGEFSCSDCKRLFGSRLSLKLHRCSLKKSSSLASTVACALCRKVFDAEEKLKAHLKAHSYESTDANKTSTSKSKQSNSKILGAQINCQDDFNFKPSESAEENVFICEVCGAIFKSSSSMKTHMFCHGDRKFECEICKKRFHRKDVLQEHIRVHQEANFPCLTCGKKYKTKKSLHVHSLIHRGFKRFSCEVCGKGFFQKGNLHKHVQTHVPERMYSCQFCQKTFSSKEYFHIHELTHTQGKIYQCDECQRSFVKKHLLDTHRQLFHSNRGFLCKFCNTVIRHRHSVRRHLEKCHSEDSKEWSLPGFIDQLLAEIPSDLVQPSRDTKSSPKQQQKRKKLLESLRSRHFQKKSEITIDAETSSISVEADISQEDSSVLFPSYQLAFVDNILPEFDLSQSSTIARQSLMISGDIQASEGEILLTLVDQDLSNSSVENSASVLTTATLGTDIVGVDSGTAFLVEDGSETNSVFLYVVGTTDGHVGDTEDMV